MIVNNIELKNFIDLNDNEKSIILTWRNHNEVKKWMYTNEDIQFENHLKFIESLKNDISREYFLIKKDMQMIGVIYFTAINDKLKECEFGLYANPFEKIAGVGRILEEICIRYAFDFLKLAKLKLEVFECNEKARNLYKKYNFREVGNKVINEKKVICMELERMNNENR